MTDDEPVDAEVIETDATELAEPAKPRTKAERLEAKAAKLREAELAREQRRAEAPSGGVDPGSWRTATVVLAAVDLVLVVALVIGVFAWAHQRGRADSAARLSADRAAALQAADNLATNFGTYDYTTLPADFARVEKLLTPSFASSFTSIVSKLAPAITQSKGKSTATIQGSAVASISSSAAVVYVFLDQTVTNAQSTTAQIDRNRLEVDLQRQSNGTWLGSNLLSK